MAVRGWAVAALAFGLLGGRALAQTAAPAPPAPSARASAPPAPAPAPTAPPFDVAGTEAALTTFEHQVPTATDDARLADIQGRAARIQAQAARIAAQDRAQARQIEAGLKTAHGRREPASQRALLTAEAAQWTNAASRMEALAARADRVFELAAERRREGFSARVLQPTASLLTPDFWSGLSAAAGADVARSTRIMDEAVAVALRADEPRGMIGLGVGLLIGLLLVWPAHWLAVWFGVRRFKTLPAAAPGQMLGAAWRALADFAAPALAASAVWSGARWGDLLSPAADQLGRGAVASIAWGAAVIAVGRAIANSCNWRGRATEGGGTTGLRVALWSAAIVTAGGSFLQTWTYLAGASVATTVAGDAAIALAYACVAGLLLVSVAFGQKTEDGQDPESRPVWSLLSLGLAAAILATVAALLLGYATLAVLISSQVFWLSLVAMSAFIAMRLVDDLLAAAVAPSGRSARALAHLFGLRSSTVSQVGLLLSAGLQVLIVVAAVVLALTPFGESGQLLVAHLRDLGADIHLGKIVISPVSVMGGLVTLAVGIGLAHLARRWVTRRYLPVTRWDAGVRNSVSTGVGYVGVAIALVAALAVTGVGLQQMALVASALSVGIGFGLQQIVQNFVAGIILLIERPVKVGDWVNVGGVEGDIRDIRVRATEIATPGGSTVIVPNSSLITGNLENKTPGARRPRLQLQVAIPKPQDIGRARDLILKLAAERTDVLKQPAPEVFILSLAAGGGATLEAWLSLADPSATMRVRSEFYGALLDAFQGAGVTL